MAAKCISKGTHSCKYVIPPTKKILIIEIWTFRGMRWRDLFPVESRRKSCTQLSLRYKQLWDKTWCVNGKQSNLAWSVGVRFGSQPLTVGTFAFENLIHTGYYHRHRYKQLWDKTWCVNGKQSNLAWSVGVRFGSQPLTVGTFAFENLIHTGYYHRHRLPVERV